MSSETEDEREHRWDRTAGSYPDVYLAMTRTAELNVRKDDSSTRSMRIDIGKEQPRVHKSLRVGHITGEALAIGL